MKKILLTAVAMLAALSVYGQGNVNFANVGVGLNSPFVDGTAGGARLTGGTWTIELWVSSDASGTGAVMAGAAYTGAFANGFFNAGQRTAANVTGGSAFAQVRVWDNMGGTITSYGQASSTAGVRFGLSTDANPNWFAINLSQPPATPATMVNMPAISVHVIPEPSTIALGLIGAVGAFLFRRRK